jgi:hypothetical protein
MQYKKRGMTGVAGPISFAVLLIAVFSVLFMSSIIVRSTSSASGSSVRLEAYDLTDAKAGSLTKYVNQNVTFYANFTDITDGTPIRPIGGVFCNITLNKSGSWAGPFNMSYDFTSNLYWHNDSSTWKGVLDFNVSCMANSTFSFEWLNVTDNYTITNTYPSISPKPLPDFTCYEDACGTYDFSANCSDVDVNEVLIYSRDAQTYFSCFSMDNLTGIIDLSGCDNSNEAVNNYVMSLIVTDSDDKPDIVDQTYTVIAVNDAPAIDISDCSSASPGAEDTLFTCDVTASDEEDGTEAGGLLNFTANETWFSIGLTSGQVSFTPSNSEVGTHHINITVNDTGGSLDSSTLELQITNVNDPPSLIWVCYNTSYLLGTNTTENAEFTCRLNASDIDNGDSLAFLTNTSWFAMNSSYQASYDGLGNFSTLVNFTARDDAVGAHHINISVNDSSTGSDWLLINFTVFDVPDTPAFLNIVNGSNITGFEFVWLDYTILAHDNDTYWNSSEFINFTHNQTTLFNFTYLNTTATRIYFRPVKGEAGQYDIRINITDGSGNINYSIINLTIYSNSPPYAPNISLTCYDTNSTFNNSCYYNLSQNVTEPNSDTFNFTDNSTLFDINVTSGEINFTANDTSVGNHTVWINLTDKYGAINFTLLYIEINNVNDAPSLNLKNWTAYQTVVFNIDLTNNVSDQDTNVPSGIFNETFGFFAVNASNQSQSLMTFLNMTVNGSIYLVPNATHIGNFSINITVNDSAGVQAWQAINLTVYAYNNPPMFTWVCNNTSPVTEDDNVTCWLNATDIDSKNLTFDTNVSWFSLNKTAQPINLTNPNATSLVNFTPTFSEVGNHSILVNVTDDEGAYDEAVIDLEVKVMNLYPTIDWWRWVTSDPSNLSTTATNFLSKENESIVFTHTSSDADGDPLTYTWLINGTQNSTSANTTWQVPFHYSNLSVVNVTLKVTDSKGASVTQQWNVTVIHVNLPPELYKNITNQTWPENTQETFNISTYIRDFDGDNLTFTYNLSSDCQATPCMNITFSGTSGDYVATLTPASNWWGITNVSITANDSEYTATSNSFMLNVTYVPRQTQIVYVRTSGGSGGSGGSSQKVASLNIEIKPLVIVKENELISAEIFLENTGEITLNTLNLTAETDYRNISLSLRDTFFEKLDIGANATTYLTMDITKAEKGRYEIRMIANVSNPKLNETATIYLETTPINKTYVEVKIEFVKDLFEDNPECMELMELVFQAETALGQKDIDKASNLTKIAMDNCRDLIQYGDVSGQLPSLTQPLTINLQPLDIAIVFAIAIAIWFAISRVIRPKFGSKNRGFMPT